MKDAASERLNEVLLILPLGYNNVSFLRSFHKKIAFYVLFGSYYLQGTKVGVVSKGEVIDLLNFVHRYITGIKYHRINGQLLIIGIGHSFGSHNVQISNLYVLYILNLHRYNGVTDIVNASLYHFSILLCLTSINRYKGSSLISL